MTNTRELIPIAGLGATCAFAAYMVVQLSGQAAATPAADLSHAAVAEVHDAQGQVVLRGQFVPAPEDDDDVERKARLEPAGSAADASGDAEVEISKQTPARQEIEFSVRRLPPGATVTFVIDGQPVGQATVDQRGRAELDVDVNASSPAASR